MPRVDRDEISDAVAEQEELDTDLYYLNWFGTGDREEGRRREREYQDHMAWADIDDARNEVTCKRDKSRDSWTGL
jgi:hypothetical protein